MLKDVAEYLGLSTSAVSRVLNDKADSIPQETKDRIFAAARELNYRPNYAARSLRGKPSRSIGVLMPEISEGYAAGIMNGIEPRLLKDGYFYLMASHRSRSELLDEYLTQLEDRNVEGFILVAAAITKAPRFPTVVVSGHRPIEGVTNVVLDHDRAALQALTHLAELGHERIAFFRGSPGNVDTDDRWQAIRRAATTLGLEIRPQLVLDLVSQSYGPVSSSEDGYQEGHAFGRKLLNGGSEFTALFAFNDFSAIGAMRAFIEADLRIPDDVSVVGFDDIQSAAFWNPSLTTVRQPLRRMGEVAAETLLQRVSGDDTHPAEFLTVEPELIVRDSTGPAAT